MSSGLEILDAENDTCCDIPFKTRLICGCVCGGIGGLFTFVSFIEFARSEWVSFAVIYSIATIACVASSFFIAGPKTHIKQLKVKEHLISTICLFVFIALVLVFALAVKSIALAIIFVILQIVALVFFYITLTSLGTTALRAAMRKICPCCA